jgi:glycine cleavage system H protein
VLYAVISIYHNSHVWWGIARWRAAQHGTSAKKRRHTAAGRTVQEREEIAVSTEYLETTVDKFIFRVKVGYLYSEDGVWVAYNAANSTARVGLTDFRQQASGDVAFVDLPAVGAQLEAGGDLANIETIKVDLAVPAPFGGEVVAVNEGLGDATELINQDPYGAGWLVDLKPKRWPVDGLLDAPAYLAVMQAQAEAEAAK